MGKNIMDEFKVSTIDELRKIPAEKLLKSNYTNNAMTIDPYSLPDYPWKIYAKQENNEEALLNGFNAKEGFAFTFFSKINKKNYKELLLESPFLKDVDDLCSEYPVSNNKEAKSFYTEVFSAICFTYPHYSWTKVVREQGRPVYEYFFSKENGGIGTNHSGEMIYAYGNVEDNKNYDDSDYALQEIMTSYWVNFCKNGNPNGNIYKEQKNGLYEESSISLPYWQSSLESEGRLLELGSNVYMREDPYLKFYKYMKTWSE